MALHDAEASAGDHWIVRTHAAAPASGGVGAAGSRSNRREGEEQAQNDSHDHTPIHRCHAKTRAPSHSSSTTGFPNPMRNPSTRLHAREVRSTFRRLIGAVALCPRFPCLRCEPSAQCPVPEHSRARPSVRNLPTFPGVHGIQVVNLPLRLCRRGTKRLAYAVQTRWPQSK